MGEHLAIFAAAHGADIGDQPAFADEHLDLAADLAGHRDRRIGVGLKRGQSGPSMRICEPEPAISTTSPIGDSSAARRLGCGAGFLGEAADFVEEFTQVRLLVHIATSS